MGSKFLTISSGVKGVDVDVVSAGAACVGESCDACAVELYRRDHSRGLGFGTRALGRAPARDLHGSRAAMAQGCYPPRTLRCSKKFPFERQLDTLQLALHHVTKIMLSHHLPALARKGSILHLPSFAGEGAKGWPKGDSDTGILLPVKRIVFFVRSGTSADFFILLSTAIYQRGLQILLLMALHPPY